MDIAEVAKRSGMPASALRYYEEKGLIASTGRAGLRRAAGGGVPPGRLSGWIRGADRRLRTVGNGARRAAALRLGNECGAAPSRRMGPRTLPRDGAVAAVKREAIFEFFRRLAEDNPYLDAMQAISDGRYEDARRSLASLAAQEPEHAGAWLDQIGRAHV